MRGINGKWKLAQGAAEPMGEGLEKGRLHANEPNHLEGCSKAWWTNQARHTPAEIKHMSTPMPMKANGAINCDEILKLHDEITEWHTVVTFFARVHKQKTLTVHYKRKAWSFIMYVFLWSNKKLSIESTTHSALFAWKIFKKSNLYFGFGFCSL